MLLGLEGRGEAYDLSISAGAPLRAPLRQPCSTCLLVGVRDKGGRASTLCANMRMATLPRGSVLTRQLQCKQG